MCLRAYTIPAAAAAAYTIKAFLCDKKRMRIERLEAKVLWAQFFRVASGEKRESERDERERKRVSAMRVRLAEEFL
jgi:hypothetical protein